MTRLSLIFSLCACGLSASPLAADEAERLANLSKSAFLAEYEDRFVQSLEMSEELMRRFDPAYAEVFDTDTPATAEEREGFACVYDAMAAKGGLAELARHSLATHAIIDRIEANPDFDYVDLMDPALEDAVENMTPSDGMIEAMSACGTMSLTADRMTFSDAFWTDMMAAAVERGYIEDE